MNFSLFFLSAGPFSYTPSRILGARLTLRRDSLPMPLVRFCRLIPWINTYCKVGSFAGKSAVEQEAEEIRRGDAPEG